MDTLGDRISRQEWLKPVESTLGAIADTIFKKDIPSAERVRDFLHGTWLGHPLHPVITDIPIGAWTAATVFDLIEVSTGDEHLAEASDFAVGMGLLGAVGAAVSGLNDWNVTSDKPRRVGALHALLNIGATLCYLGSWWQRRNGCRPAALTTSFAGYGLALLGAYLGGHLVYNERIGVNHAPEELPQEYTPLLNESELEENVMRKVEANGIPVLVVKSGGRIFVLAEKCSHLGGPLSEGKFDGRTVTCPWHNSTFSIEDGAIVTGPTAYRQPCFEVRVRDGVVEGRAPRGMVPNPY
jgi:nitrite reductase/ring-hydroxylating ferredoxin subunit/uncharacterized membrane protein